MKILLLGSGWTSSDLTARIAAAGPHQLDHQHIKTDDFSAYNLVLCYDYSHVIADAALATLKRPIVNLALGWLPYNRGADPEFWAFADNSPTGVSLHEIDSTINGGPLIDQGYVAFDTETTTFRQARDRLRKSAEKLLLDNLDAILDGTYRPRLQRGFGSFHQKADRPESLPEDMPIARYLETYDRETLSIREKLALVDAIENVRSRNNVNWMDLLRLAIKASPLEAKQLFKKINSSDNEISRLFEQLGR